MSVQIELSLCKIIYWQSVSELLKKNGKRRKAESKRSFEVRAVQNKSGSSIVKKKTGSVMIRIAIISFSTKFKNTVRKFRRREVQEAINRYKLEFADENQWL